MSRRRACRRHQRQDSTRQRIVEATIRVHIDLGVMGSNFSSVAREAGVSRQTVARYFRDEVELITACTAHYDLSHPMPATDRWVGIADPQDRLRAALTDLYAYYNDNEPILASGHTAAAARPELAVVFAPYIASLRETQAVLAAGWNVGSKRSSPLKAAIGHALAFPTWRSLRRDQGLTNGQAVSLMVALTAVAGL